MGSQNSDNCETVMKLVSNGFAISFLFSVSQAGAFSCDDRKSGVYIHPSTCGRYYTCVDGISKPYETDCPADLVFDYTKSACNFRELVDCARSDPCIVANKDGSPNNGWMPGVLKCLGVEPAVISEDKASDITPVRTDEWDRWCNGKPYGVHLDPNACNSFVTCTNATTVDGVFAIGHIATCPGDQMFDHKVGACSVAEGVDCRGGSRSDACIGNGHVATVLKCLGVDTDAEVEYPPLATRSTTWDGFCQERNKPGVYLHPSDCGKYITCTNATFGNELTCPGNDLKFDPAGKFAPGCNFGYLVHCERGTYQDNSGCIASSNGHVADIRECLGIKEPTKEPQPLKMRPRTDESANRFCAGKDAGIYTNDGTCKNYYTCIEGKTENIGVQLTCPGELVFDHTLSACNFASSVDCRSGVRSDDKGCTAGCAGKTVDCIVKCYYPKRAAEAARMKPGNEAPTIQIDSRLNNFCEGKETGIHINEYSCDSFLSCIEGIFDPIVTQCPGNFKFNHEKSSCDFDRNVDCGRASYRGCNGFVPCIVEQIPKEKDTRRKRSPKFF